MKRIISLIFTFFLVQNLSFSQNAIFLHHSTGGAVYSDGNVEGWISNYNTTHGTSYSVTERAYPNSPYPWENYPYDFWNLWVNGDCDSGQSGIECLSSLTQNYNVIIFKHCFPGAGIEADLGTPDVSSNRKSLENYKAQYRALRNVMDHYPNNQFIVWTLAPLHRNATNADDAARAREFVDWVNSTWLNEDGNSHPNIYIFDFFDIVAESNPSPSNGQVNCLRYEYEGDHDGSDSHPNYDANQVAGPLFAKTIVDCMQSMPDIQVDNIDIYTGSGYERINTNDGRLQMIANVYPENASNKSVTWSIIDGEEFAEISAAGELHALRNGEVRVQAAANDGSGVHSHLDIMISNQDIYVESIDVRAEEATNNIATNSGTLHLYAFSFPENLRYTDVTWSIISGSEHISFSESGVVTALSNGTTRVSATLNDGSGIHDFFDISISNQTNMVESIEIYTEGNISSIDTEGGSLQLMANVLPENTTSSVIWSIIDGEGFAEITPDGMLHALHNGIVQVQAAADDGSGITSFIDITITNQPIFVESLEIRSEEETNLIFSDNGTLQLYAFSYPESVRYENVTWTITFGAEHISISETGLVTALTNGVASVMATTNNGSGINDIFDIVVSNQITPIESIEIETEGGITAIDTEGGSLQLMANVLPENTTSSVIWSVIGGEEFAEITPDGVLHALRNGAVRVQATADDGSGVTSFIDITITNQPVFVESIEIRSDEETNFINTDSGTLHLYAFSYPESVRYENVTWSITFGAEVISISETGLVTALTNGVASVMATANNGSGINDFFDIVVSNQIIPIESIEIETEGGITAIETEGGSLQLTAKVTPENTTSTVIWSVTGGEEFAEITPDGVLHALRNGAVRVQAAANDGSGITSFIDITITNQPIFVESLEIRSEEETNLIFSDNGTLHLYAFSYPESVRYENVTWSITFGAEHISISETGLVTALSNGTASVMATTNNGSAINDIFDIVVSNQIIPIQSIEIETEGGITAIETEGGSLQLTAKVTPENTTSTVIWSIIEGEEFAEITPEGELHALRNGTLLVQAEAYDNSDINATIEITITNQPIYVESLEIRSEEGTSLINTDNGTLQLYAFSFPENVRYENVTWSIVFGDDVISISDSGTITALSDGIASVMVSNNSGFPNHDFFDITVMNQIIPIESIEIETPGNVRSINTKGGSIQLSANILPQKSTNKNITWSIIDGEEFAEISLNGMLHALRNGTVQVQAGANDGSGVYSTIDITITHQPIFVESLEIRSEEGTNLINTDNGTLRLYAFSLPESVRSENVTWSIIVGAEVISISESGTVTALSDGTATVKVTTKDGSGIQYLFDIIVSNQVIPVESIEIRSTDNATAIDIKGGSLQLFAIVLPENATNQDVTWSITTGNEYGSLSEYGLLTASNNGTIVVQATSVDGSGAKDTYSIIVSNQLTSVDKLAKSGMKLTFNKGEGSYTVLFGDDHSSTSLKMYSVAGKLIWSGKGDSNSFTLPRQKPGVYVLQLQKDDRRYTEKLVY